MKSSIHRLILVALTVIGSAAIRADAGGDPPGVDPIIGDRAIVHVLDGADLDAFIAAFEADHSDPEVTLTAIDAIPGRPMHLLAVGLPDPLPPGLLDQLEVDLQNNYGAFLVSGEFLYENQAPEGKTGSTFVDGLGIDGFENQYARTLLNLESAHAHSRGAGIAIALLDTGLDPSHPVMDGRVLPNGYDFIDNDTDTSEQIGDGTMAGHGTFVAGLIAMTAPDAKLLPVRVLDADGVGDGWLLTKGLFYAIDQGVEVINLSLGSTYDAASVEQAIIEAESLGILVVSSAGNFDRNEPREFPAMEDDQGFGVAATDHADIKADFSNYNRRLGISAPGDADTDVLDPSTAIVSTVPGDEYRVWKGTSFAAPFVSAAAAIVRGQHPEWPADLSTALNVKAVLRATAVDIYPLNPEFAPDQQLGAGRLDIGAAAADGPIAPDLGDLNADGVINVFDLLLLLDMWGDTHTSADLDLNGIVNVFDLLILLENWG
jgi:subtilisin family serine protease